MKKLLSKIKLRIIKKDSIVERFDGLFTNNPIFVSGLALTPIIIGAITLKYSVLIISIMSFIYISVSIFAILFGKYIKLYRRDFIFAVVGSLMFPIASKIADQIDEKAVINLGIYLPIIVVDSLILVKCHEYSNSTDRKIIIFKKMIYTIIGFIIPCLLMGAIREYIAYGTIWDKVVNTNSFHITHASNTFLGFIFLGFMTAIYQKLSMYRKKEISLNQEGNDIND